MSKGTTVYNPNPKTVVKTKGSMISAKNADTSVTRNSSFFKKLTFQEINPPHVEEYTEESQIPVSFPNVNPPTTSERQTTPAQEVSKPPQQENSSNKDIQNGSVQIPTIVPETENEQMPALRRSTWRRIPRKIRLIYRN
jgi:hypothetical protein